MNAILPIETSARVKAGGSPLTRLDASLNKLNIAAYTAFRNAVVVELVDGESDIRNAILRDQVQSAPNIRSEALDQLKNLTSMWLRDSLRVRPGDGKKPITISYYLSYLVSKPTADVFKNMPSRQDMIEFLRSNESDLAGKTLNDLGTDESNPTHYAYFKDVCKLYINRSVTDDDTIMYRLDIELDSAVYPYVIDSDSFSPYLVYVWINNAVSMRASRAQIIDPRKSAALTNQMIARYAGPTTAKPRTNKAGFAIFKNGMPIAIPAQVDATKELVAAGDSSLDQDGEFDLTSLVENSKMANKIIYVDWLNDVLVYTTSRCTAEVLDLSGTMKLDEASEAVLLSGAITDPALVEIFNVIDTMFYEINIDDIQVNMPKDTEFLLERTTPGTIRARLISVSGTRGPNSDIQLSHLAGHNLSDFEDDPNIVTNIINYRAYIKALYKSLSQNKIELKLSGEHLARTVRFRILGFDYILWALANHTQESIEALVRARVEERQKELKSPQRTFEIPNLDASQRGLTGLLPHQGDIISSTSKTPSLMILPVDTGGGKTLLALITAIYAIQNRPNIIPMITTKGNLVKGIITELNKVSQGKINPVPLRPFNLRRMKRMAGIKTFADLIKWFRSLPRNTIFINSYTDYSSRSKIYEELPSIPGMLQQRFLDSQYLRIVRLLGINMLIADESHIVKNADRNRSKGASNAFGAAEVRAIMSGTLLSNTIVDLVGQTKLISPLIFGEDADAFADRYGISSGLIKEDDTAKMIRNRMSSIAAVHSATKDQWSYMLPDKADTMAFVQLTEKQSLFYTKLVNEALIELNTNKKLPKANDEDSDDEEDEDSEEDEDEDGDEKIVAKLKAVLSTVEQFIAAPDANTEYVNQVEDPPTGEDLVSPKVRMADRLIEEHLAKHKGNMSTNKLIVFAVNVSAVEHFARHSKFASKALVYYAGDQNALFQWVNDPTKEILVAAETSVREGENWQFSSRILRMQSVWAPGDHEQTIARMYRPDPRGRYNRDFVEHTWILVNKTDGEPTIDGLKMARLASKFISNARFTYENTPSWRQVSKNFDNLDLLTLSPSFVQHAKQEDLTSYFGAWNIFINWQNNHNLAERLSKARLLEAQTGEDLIDDKTGKIRDINRFISLAMCEVTSNTTIPGSKRVYVPWAPGAVPADPNNLGLEVLGSRPVREGDVVMMELGPAIVRSITSTSLKVEIFGGRIVGVRRLATATVPPANYHKLAELVSNPSKWRAHSLDPFDNLPPLTAKGGKTNTTPARNETLVPNTNDEDGRESVDVRTAILNGMPALIIMDETDSDDAIRALGWQEVDEYLSISFRTWGALQTLLEELDSLSSVSIPDKTYNALLDEIDELKSGRAMTLTKRVDPNAVRQFFIDQRRKLGRTDSGKYIVKPYIIAVEREIRLAFDVDSHDTKIIRWLKTNAPKISGVLKVRTTKPFMAKIFNNAAEARKHLTDLSKVIDFDSGGLNEEITEMNAEIQELQAKRSRPIR